ncbi:transketolase [Methanofollis fontis]|uniref:Transketolase n=1 Tax=Methanofollis fontis TaxID=2052832 RepID=A0A483CL77_9EURY|nr:transketolase [Methanofollis fontis]TAJ43698.1 transketolase [Methanofollis fontis]
MQPQARLNDLNAMSKRMRLNIIKLAYQVGNNGAHIAPALSCNEIIAVLYGDVMNLNPKNPVSQERDRFLIGKGHGALALYAALCDTGFFSEELLFTYQKNGGDLPGQPSMNLSLGIEVSSGSLGNALSVGEGIALSAKKNGDKYKTYVLLGDGECNEGTIWETAMSASHFRLDNLIAIVDLNGMQSDGQSAKILNMGNFREKWSSFGWNVIEADGHDIESLYNAFHAIKQERKPTVILAHTIKGHGVSFMENNNSWHHNHLSSEQYELALSELEAK